MASGAMIDGQWASKGFKTEVACFLFELGGNMDSKALIAVGPDQTASPEPPALADQALNRSGTTTAAAASGATTQPLGCFEELVMPQPAPAGSVSTEYATMDASQDGADTVEAEIVPNAKNGEQDVSGSFGTAPAAPTVALIPSPGAGSDQDTEIEVRRFDRSHDQTDEETERNKKREAARKEHEDREKRQEEDQLAAQNRETNSNWIQMRDEFLRMAAETLANNPAHEHERTRDR